MDQPTREYIRELLEAARNSNSPDKCDARKRFMESAQQAIGAAQEFCECENCTRERLKKEMMQEQLNKILQDLSSKIVPPMPGNFIPDLSPDPMYWRLGRRG